MNKALKDFLFQNTKTEELCIIRESGYVILTIWIDDEDLWRKSISSEFINKKIKSDSWDTLLIRDSQNQLQHTNVHYIDL